MGFGSHYWNVSVSEGTILLKVQHHSFIFQSHLTRVAILCFANIIRRRPGSRQDLHLTPLSSRLSEAMVQDRNQVVDGIYS
jgi:hypothetical protein